MKKVIPFILILLMVMSMVACGKDKDKDSEAAGYDPLATNTASEGGDSNPDAWWQQYTTAPVTVDTTKAGEKATTKSGSGSKTTTKKGATTTKASSGAKTTAASKAPAKYKKIDADTMQYNVKDGNATGVVTLTKAKSNTYVSKTVLDINKTFGTSYTNANTMCFSSTLPSMKGTDIVFVFDSGKKTTNTLRYVCRYDGGKQTASVTVVDENTKEKTPLYFWPCLSSGNEAYNQYLNIFKTGLEKEVPGGYAEGTGIFKSLLSDECVKEFLTW